MRNVKYIIQEARTNTNTTDNEAISDYLCTMLLNRCLNHLCNMLYNKNVRTLLFRKQFSIFINRDVFEYDLPFDAFAKTGVINVFYKQNDLAVKFLPRIADVNRNSKFGYVLNAGKIYVRRSSDFPSELVVTYSARPPLFGLPYGTIESVDNNEKIVLSSDRNPEPILKWGEFFCVIDIDGNIVRRSIRVDQSGDELLLDDTSGIEPGMTVVIGKYNTTHCPISEELEPSLLSMLEFLINARLSSKDIPVSDAISSAIIDELTELFTDPSADPMTPPEVEYNEWL